MTKHLSGSAYGSPNPELIMESERIYKGFCNALQVSTGLNGAALRRRIKECDSATYQLLFGEEKQTLNVMEQVYLNWHRELMTALMVNK